MANIWEKASPILVGNLNWGLSYLITTVPLVASVAKTVALTSSSAFWWNFNISLSGNSAQTSPFRTKKASGSPDLIWSLKFKNFFYILAIFCILLGFLESKKHWTSKNPRFVDIVLIEWLTKPKR